MAKSIKNNSLLGDIDFLREKYDRVLGKHKVKKATKSPRPPKANSKRIPGKIWESTNGYLYTYDEQLSPRPLHRVVVERVIGRPLRSDEKVGFADGNKLNCEPGNLTLLTPTPLSDLVCRLCSAKLIQDQYSSPNSQCTDESPSTTYSQIELSRLPHLEL